MRRTNGFVLHELDTNIPANVTNMTREPSRAEPNFDPPLLPWHALCVRVQRVCVVVVARRPSFLGVAVLLGARVGDGEGGHWPRRPEDGVAQGQREA